MYAQIEGSDQKVIILPRKLLEATALRDGAEALVHVNPDGSLLLAPVPATPVREYTDEDLEMFAQENAWTPELRARVQATANG